MLMLECVASLERGLPSLGASVVGLSVSCSAAAVVAGSAGGWVVVGVAVVEGGRVTGSVLEVVDGLSAESSDVGSWPVLIEPALVSANGWAGAWERGRREREFWRRRREREGGTIILTHRQG